MSFYEHYELYFKETPLNDLIGFLIYRNARGGGPDFINPFISEDAQRKWMRGIGSVVGVHIFLVTFT